MTAMPPREAIANRHARRTKTSSCATRFAVVGSLMLAFIGDASAVEDVTPFLPGSSIGVPAGLLPPPGVYGGFGISKFDLKVKGGAGRNTGADIDSFPMAATVLWVPDFKVLGASYAVGVVQPFRQFTLTTPRLTKQAFAQVNTILNVSTLSWKLGNGFFISTGMNVYIPTGDYAHGRVVNTGRNYYTLEPRVGLSYVADGWSLSSNLLLDVNTENPLTNYRSGNVVALDLTASRRFFGRLELGLGADITKQLTSDRQHDLVVPALSNGRGRGNKVHYASIGPIVGYDFGAFTLQVYYQQAVSARNTAAGSQVWARVNFPIYTKTPPSQAQLESAGRR